MKKLYSFVTACILILANPENMSFADGMYEIPKQKIDTYSFIMKYECGGGPKHLMAYWDYRGWSIGCGTPSYEGETITKQEAIRRFNEYTKKRIVTVLRDFPKATQDQQTALVSLASNNGTCYKIHKTKGLTRSQWLSCDKVRIDGKLIALRGLTKRRIEEVKLYFGY